MAQTHTELKRLLAAKLEENQELDQSGVLIELIVALLELLGYELAHTDNSKKSVTAFYLANEVKNMFTIDA